MASLLPALPSNWNPTVTAPQRQRSVTAARRHNVICNGTLPPSSCELDRERWGTDKRVYGGIGVAVDDVIRRGGATSRSHHHYGNGVTNLAQRQSYQITDLSLKDSRPHDILLPPPLLTSKIINQRQVCRYPSNHTYTSHRSKFSLFPLSGDTMVTTHLTPLSQQTTKTLQQVNHSQFCTSTYQQNHSNPWPHLTTQRNPSPPKISPFTTQTTPEPATSTRRIDEADAVPVNQKISVGGCCKGKCDEEEKVKKTVHWQEEDEEEEGSGEKEEEVKKDEVKDREEEKKKKEKQPAIEEKENEEDKEQENESDIKNSSKEEAVEEIGEKTKDRSLLYLPGPPTATTTTTAAAAIPYYLNRHSILQSLILKPADLKLPGLVKKDKPSTKEDGAKSNDVMRVGVANDVIGNDVIDERETPPTSLSSMLNLSGGSRKAHCHLGSRFKSQAHSRYHQLYTDKIPDLRDSRIESKKYFFFGFHSSVLR